MQSVQFPQNHNLKWKWRRTHSRVLVELSSLDLLIWSIPLECTLNFDGYTLSVVRCIVITRNSTQTIIKIFNSPPPWWWSQMTIWLWRQSDTNFFLKLAYYFGNINRFASATCPHDLFMSLVDMDWLDCQSSVDTVEQINEI